MRIHSYSLSPTCFNSFHLILLLTITIAYATPGQTYMTYNSNTLTTWEQIHQTLNTYPLAVDGKRWDLFPKIFTQNVTANYTGPVSNITGLPALQSVLTGYVSSLLSQHQLGTTVIDLSDDQTTANSTQYFTATLWSTAPETKGDFLILFGLYADDLVFIKDEG